MDLINFFQYAHLLQDSSETSKASESAEAAGQHVEELRESFERLALVCQAMWELLRESNGLTEEDLIAKVREVDLRDGRADGRSGATPRDCPSCSRTNSSRHDRCLYCGAELPAGGAFGKV